MPQGRHHEPERCCFHTVVSVLNTPSTVADLATFEAKEKAEDWRTAYHTEPCLPIRTKEGAIEVQIGGGRIGHTHVANCSEWMRAQEKTWTTERPAA